MSGSFDNSKLATEKEIVEKIKKVELPLKNKGDLDPLMDFIGEAKYVLLGEATHGTHEYYNWRTKITKRLILEKGFSFIGVEGDWPDCYRLNRYIKGYKSDQKSASEVLKTFDRWPTWMWANWEIVALAEWLHEHNKDLPATDKVGFYGLDVYSLRESIEAILSYLKKTDPHTYDIAKKAAECFQPYGYEGVTYARFTKLIRDNCEHAVIDLLKSIQNKIALYNTDHESVFNAEQNAIIALHAENYYRQMIQGGPVSWNIRDEHMVETVERLMKFHGKNAKVIVWEHNTHIGDGRATAMSRDGMVNVGELLTKNHEEKEVVKVGFGSYKGKVKAGRNWEDKMRTMEVPEARKGSWEELLHRAGATDKLILFDQLTEDPLFFEPIDHRAIGVVYNPDNDHNANYVPSILPYRYDAFIYLDETSAVHPLHSKPADDLMPETYPWGD